MKKGTFFLLILMTTTLVPVNGFAGWGSGGGNGYVCFKEFDGKYSGKEIVQFLFHEITSRSSDPQNGSSTLNLTGFTRSIDRLEMLEMDIFRRHSLESNNDMLSLFNFPSSEKKFATEKRVVYQLGIIFDDIQKQIQAIATEHPKLKTVTRNWSDSATLLRKILTENSKEDPSQIYSPPLLRYVRDVEDYRAPLIAGNASCIDATFVKQDLYRSTNKTPSVSIETNLYFLKSHMDYYNQFLLWFHETVLLTERSRLKRHETATVREIVFRALLKDKKEADLVNWLNTNGYQDLISLP